VPVLLPAAGVDWWCAMLYMGFYSTGVSRRVSVDAGVDVGPLDPGDEGETALRISANTGR
jgi:hypothetical protein